MGQTPLAPAAEIAALLGLIVGAGTFSGSLVASGKLANRLRQTPVVLPGHNTILATLVLLLVALSVWAGLLADGLLLRTALVALIAGSVVLGIVLAVRIGGADMPVLISFLNATAGLAAALCGVAIGNRLLIACGATVAASGSILTHVMCRGMNRGLASVFTGIRPLSTPDAPTAPDAAERAPGPIEALATDSDGDLFSRALGLLREAQRVIVIPGYGMALAEAQDEVVRLGERLAELGKNVRFAIHPVAGRMPGHMHVLLAEADVDYDCLCELKDVDHEFTQTDLALIVGACDVVNPAAIERSDTPISGMPILKAHEARHVVVCNLDEKPGYSGVENPLYRNPNTTLLLGDARDTVNQLRQGLN